MAGFMDPILAQISRQGDIMMYGQQLQRQRQQDDQAQRQQGLQERQTLAQLAALEQQQALGNKRRQTLADLVKPRQVGGPLAGVDQYQPVGMQTPQFDDSAAYQALMGIGDVEGAMQFKPDPLDYQIVESSDGFIYLPERPGSEPVPTGVKKPTTYTPFGHGQMRGSDGSIVPVPTAPTSGAGGATPYFTPIQTADGVYSFDARTGTITPTGGVVGSSSDPELQRRISEAKAAGKEFGTAGAEAQIDLPRVVTEAKKTVGLVDNLLRHPGFKQAVGTSRALGIQKIPGTSARSFDIALNQIKGKQFLQAFQSLKGGGHITEIEGQKATEAISRMDAANTEQEFIAAARDFQDVIRTGIANAERKAKIGSQGQGQNQGNQPPIGIKFLGFE